PNRSWDDLYEDEVVGKLQAVSSYKALFDAHHRALEEVEAFAKEKGLFGDILPPGKHIYWSKDEKKFAFNERLTPGKLGNGNVLYINGLTPPDDYSDLRVAQHVIQLLYPGTVYMRHKRDILKEKMSPTLQGALKYIRNPFWLTEEGWNAYVLELMEEQGFFNRNPLEHLSVLRQLYRNAVLANAVKHYMTQEQHLGYIKVYLSYALQLGKKDVDNTIDKMLRKPEVYLFRVLGREMIYALREKVRQKEGDAFSLRSFHDRFIEGGALPIPIIAELQFGVTLTDDDVLRHVKQLEHRQRSAKEALEAQARKQAQPPNTPNASNASNSRSAGAGG
ncbi:MAG: DUF885 family protein, partial [Cyanobacteria bacterium HKST-UBA03]|nr:DUF885 family protein [Cyanobacteria bacterium HKST-UBA03]